jgi:hypothetical protein
MSTNPADITEKKIAEETVVPSAVVETALPMLPQRQPPLPGDCSRSSGRSGEQHT